MGRWAEGPPSQVSASSPQRRTSGKALLPTILFSTTAPFDKSPSELACHLTPNVRVVDN